MNKTLKIASPWSQLAVFLMLLGGGWVATSFVGAGILLSKVGIKGLHGVDLSDPSLTGTLKLTQALATVMLFGLPAFFYARLTTRAPALPFLGFRPATNGYFYLLGVAVLLCSFPAQGWLGELNKQISLPAWMTTLEKDADKQLDVFLRVRSNADLYINLFVIALLPAIFEEACFRGALQRILINCFKSPWAGIVVTGLFFSAFHMQFAGFLPRAFMGILLGAVFWYSGSLWVSILAHFFINGVQVVAVSYYPKTLHENPSVPVYMSIVSLLLVVGLLSLTRKGSTASYAAVYEQDATDEMQDFQS